MKVDITVEIRSRKIVKELTRVQRSSEKRIKYLDYLKYVTEYEFDIEEELSEGWEFVTIIGSNADYAPELSNLLVLR